MNNEKLIEELEQFLAYAEREGVVNSEQVNKLEKFVHCYVKEIDIE